MAHVVERGRPSDTADELASNALAVLGEVAERDGRFGGRLGRMVLRRRSRVVLVRDRENVLDPDVKKAREALEFGGIVLQVLYVLVHVFERVDVLGRDVAVRVEVADHREGDAPLGPPHVVHFFARLSNTRTQHVHGSFTLL